MNVKSGKKRPYQRRKTARPGEIIDAALFEFVENGYSAANLDRVADAAGVSKGTIYHYFGTKQAVFEAVIRIKILDPLQNAEPGIDAQSNLSETLSGALWLAYELGKASGGSALLMTLIMEGDAFPDLRRSVLQTIFEKTEDVIRSTLEQAQSRGEISEDRIPDSMFAIVFPILCATALPIDRSAGDLDLDSIVRSSIALTVSALTGKPIKTRDLG